MIANDPPISFKLASWVYKQNLNGNIPSIERTTLDEIRTFPVPSVTERAELYLGAAITLLDNALIGRFSPVDAKLKVASWSINDNDAVALAGYLMELGALDPEILGNDRRLIARAHVLHDQMTDRRKASAQAFVAMWFNAQLLSLYDDGIAVAVTNAGYSPLRIDRKDHEGKIDDAIVAEIRRSAFVVADFTQHRGGVYYEAGFAHGLGKRVIFTCKESDIDKLHFDVRQYNTIPWKKPDDLVGALQNRILAIFGAGPLKPDARPISG